MSARAATLAPSDPAERAHPTVDMTKVGKIIRKLHDQVCDHRQRVEITRAGCDDACVMISKKELLALEQALGIFADTAAFTNMCDELKRLLRAADAVYGPDQSEAAAS